MEILVVDDEKNARQVAVREIQKARPNDNITDFATISATLEKLERKYIPDIVFLDIEMPGMGGIELAKKIREYAPNVSIIFITGFSEYAVDAFELHVNGYIMKPVTADRIEEEFQFIEEKQVENKKKIKVQTFGNFEVYVDGKPVYFSRGKAKEMFAYLVHKNGASCTTKELSAILFEDKPYNKQLMDYLQKISQSMTKAFSKLQIDDVIVKSYNQFAVNVEVIECDSYLFCDRNEDALQAYKGEYMNQYEWADETASYLDSMYWKFNKKE